MGGMNEMKCNEWANNRHSSYFPSPNKKWKDKIR